MHSSGLVYILVIYTDHIALFCRLAIQNEFDCIALATCYIVNNVPRDELVSEISQECMRAIKPSVDVFSQALNILRSCSDGAVPETSENLITEKDGRLQINMKDDSPDDKYPILLVIHGSLTSFLKVSYSLCQHQIQLNDTCIWHVVNCNT